MDVEKVAEEHSSALRKVQDAVQSALASCSTVTSENKRKRIDRALGKSGAIKKPKMLACLEEIDQSSDPEDSD